jgi:putative flippase GtrA
MTNAPELAAPTAVRRSRLQALTTRVPKVLHHMVRYLGVSVVAFAVDYGTMTVLLKLVHVDKMIAASAGFILGLILNYLLSRVWVFAGEKSRISSRWAEFTVFAAVGAIGLILNDAVIWALTSGFGIDPLLSKLPATGVVFFWNFFLRRHLIFK